MFSLEYKQKIVDKLILQYRIYIDLLEEIKKDKFALLKMDDENLKKNLLQQIENKQIILERFSEEMSFPLPSVWIMYKVQAYKNTDKEISIVSDFIQHCSPEGYICTERFKFLNKYLFENFWNNKKSYDLLKYANCAEIINLENDNKFMNRWLENEFKITNNKISKWK